MKLFIKKQILIIVLLLGIQSLTFAQKAASNPVLDSLYTVYLNNLNTRPQLAKRAIQRWLKESRKLGTGMQIVRGYYALGNLGNLTGDYKSAVNETQKAIAILKKNEGTDGLAACYNIIGLGYKNLGQYPNAVDSFMSCLKYAKLNSDKQQEANAYQNIATLYILQKEYLKATENLDRAANLFRELKDDDGVLTTLFNFANILKQQGKFDEARKHYKTVLGYRTQEGNKAVIAYININLSQMLVEEAKYKEAIIALKKTVLLLEKLKFKSDLAIVFNDLGLCESKLGNKKEAILYFQKALTIGDQQSLLLYNADIYKNLSQLYFDEGNFKDALLYYKKGVTIGTEQNSLDKEKYVANVQERYETQLKETRIQLLEKEQKLSETELQKAELTVKRQRLIRNVLIIGFVLAIGIAIVLRLLYVQRLRAQKELGLQQEENAKQKINQMINDHKMSVIERYQEGQDEERARLAREIHDGIGSDLAGIKIAFEHYTENHKNEPQSRRIAAAIGNACMDVRSLSHQLHPLSFSKIGFSSFLKDYMDQITVKTHIEIQTFFYPEDDIDQLPNELLVDAYRIIQELLNNILKHADANHVDVQLTQHEDHLNIVVADNGVGFQKGKSQGIGLRNIKERLHKVQGEIDIDSGAGKGSSITINIPLN